MDQEAILSEDAEAHLLQEASRRRFLYRDVEELIEHGFLRHTMVFGDTTFVVFRSLMPQDVVRFHSRSSFSRPTEVLRWGLAASVWMVDGYELSIDPRENAAYHIYRDWLRDTPRSVIEMMGVVLTGFQNRINRAIRMTESFCYEPYSRSLWRMMGRPTDWAGTDNIVRRLWVAHNLLEDQSKIEERQWTHTQSIVASMSNKASKQILAALKKAEEREKNRRRQVIENAVNWVIRGDQPEEKMSVILNGREVEISQSRIKSAQTVEDLEEEMRRVFSGERDFHDEMVAQWSAGIKMRVERQREQRRQVILEARRKRDEAVEAGLEERPTMIGYTQEQLSDLRPDVLKAKTTSTVSESTQSNYVFNRYFQGELRPGVLTPGLKVTDPEAKDSPHSVKREENTQTLQEILDQRRPKLSSSDDSPLGG